MKYRKIIYIPALLLSLASCRKLLEVKETDLLTDQLALKTVANNESGVIGAYAGLGTEMGILLNAILSDEVKKGEFYNSATVHEWQYSSTDVTIRDNFTAVNPYYRVVDRVNRVLQALPGADSTRLTDTQAFRSRLRGEALFLRAFCHFEVFRYYCNNYHADSLAMPYISQYRPDLPAMPRIKMGAYFEQLQADLTECKNLVPNSLADVGRANKIAVAGLQARVALFMKRWDDAITYSTEYISALPLATSASFPGIWTDANNDEIAFELKRSASLGAKTGSLFRAVSTVVGGKTTMGTITWLASDTLWNSYDTAKDVRFKAYFKDEKLLSDAARPSHLVAKYAGGAYTTATENVADNKILRTAEMYLIRAEAKAESAASDLGGAAADINALRAARIADYAPIGAYGSKELAIADIMRERFKELAYEGFRFWDLRRKGMPVTRKASDAPTTDESSRVLPTGNFRFVLPIPNAEIQANKLMLQNPGYAN
ncbi:hypothetical protein HNQ91_004136 [Filimonas zeae]|uniref:Membrane protein n=1 Tax=Filimonas zeae TaxID=1737353 RepID=A0A917J2T6_9BACT|nr:RagB/SusD family nutrient uptake outer membrane protein [Filimonas zeae]MDR6341063.1 hypothetical protein [Filimonas zeae]GGH77376.1 membrane protein [Filimonas zeae]